MAGSSKSKDEDSENDIVDISGLEQIIEPGQARLVAEVLRYLPSKPHPLSVAEIVALLEGLMLDGGFDDLHVDGWLVGDLVYARPLELLAAVNRVRGLKVVAPRPPAAEKEEETVVGEKSK